MDLSTWNVREYKLENDGEVGFILYRPVTHGLRTKHLELSLRLQGAVSAIEEAGEREEGELPSDEQIEKILASQVSRRVDLRSSGGMSRPDGRGEGSVERGTGRGDVVPGGSCHRLLHPRNGGGVNRRRRGKRLRAALHYTDKSAPTPQEEELWSKGGWNGCKLWGACKGTRCKDGDPDEKGRDRFRTPVKLPKSRPDGCHPVDRRISRCPLKACDPWMWSAIQHWSTWSTFKSLPYPGSIAEQPSRLLDAIRILESESALLSAHYSERIMDRSRRGSGT